MCRFFAGSSRAPDNQRISHRGAARSMKVALDVSGIEAEESDGHVFHSATFSFHRTRALRTDEKSCIGRSSGSKAWNYGYYWALLYGDEPRT